MKQENYTFTGTRYLALGALALTLASATVRADEVTVRPDGSTQTNRVAPSRDGQQHQRDDSYDGPGRLKPANRRAQRPNYTPPPIDNRIRVGSPNNSFEPGRTRIDSTYTYVPGYVPPGYVVPQYGYPSNTTVVVPGGAYNVPVGPPFITPDWANPNYNTQPYITSVPAGTTIYSSQVFPSYPHYGYPAPAYGYPAYPSYGFPGGGFPGYGFPGYGFPNGSTTTTYGSVTIGGRRGSNITLGGSNTTSSNSYSVRVGGR